MWACTNVYCNFKILWYQNHIYVFVIVLFVVFWIYSCLHTIHQFNIERSTAIQFCILTHRTVHHMQINNNVDREILQRKANTASRATLPRPREVHISLNKLLQWSISLYRNGKMERMFSAVHLQNATTFMHTKLHKSIHTYTITYIIIYN